MKESEIQQAFDEYKLALANSSRRQVAVRTRNGWPTRIALLSASVAGLTAALFLFPRKAEASALVRLETAVGSAKTFEARSFMQRPSGKWVEFLHDYWAGGDLKSHVFLNTPLEATYTVSGGKALSDYAHLDHCTLEPVDDQYFGTAQISGKDPLSYVKENIDMGTAGQPRDSSVHAHEPVGGRPTYTITLERKGDKYHAEILVDKATDLPIQAEVSFQGPADQGILRYRMEYQFNQSLPSGFFDLTSSKRIIDLPSAEKQLTEAWETPLWDTGSVQIRDVSVCPDGTIWVASTGDGAQPVSLPCFLTVGDQKYVRIAQDLDPSAILGKSRHYNFHGEEVYITGFVPPESAKGEAPTAASVGLAQRDSVKPGWGLKKGSKVSSSSSQEKRMAIRQQSSKFPDYFSTLDLDHFSFQIPILETEARAEHFAEDKQFLAAGKAYEECAAAYRGFVKYAGYKPLLQAATCYRKAGSDREAQRVTAEAKELKAAHER